MLLELVNGIGLNQPRKRAVRLTDRLNMTAVVDWDVKQQNKQTKITEQFAIRTISYCLILFTFIAQLNCNMDLIMFY